MVEGLAESVAVVAEIGLHHHSQGVAFGLSSETAAVVVVEGLIDRSGAGVGSDLEGAILGRRGRKGVAVAGSLVGSEFLLVVELLQFVGVAYLVLDGLDDADDIGQFALGGGRRCSHKAEEVGIDLLAAVYADDLGHDRGEGDDRAEEEHVCGRG